MCTEKNGCVGDILGELVQVLMEEILRQVVPSGKLTWQWKMVSKMRFSIAM